jgi:hypothetical protein
VEQAGAKLVGAGLFEAARERASGSIADDDVDDPEEGTSAKALAIDFGGRGCYEAEEAEDDDDDDDAVVKLVRLILRYEDEDAAAAESEPATAAAGEEGPQPPAEEDELVCTETMLSETPSPPHHSSEERQAPPPAKMARIACDNLFAKSPSAVFQEVSSRSPPEGRVVRDAYADNEVYDADALPILPRVRPVQLPFDELRADTDDIIELTSSDEDEEAGVAYVSIDRLEYDFPDRRGKRVRMNKKNAKVVFLLLVNSFSSSAPSSAPRKLASFWHTPSS